MNKILIDNIKKMMHNVCTLYERRCNYEKDCLFGIGNNDAIIGGKTGTAQVVKLKMVGERRLKADEVSYMERDHAWIASWGKKDDQEFVVVVMIEHGGMGSSTAGPIARKVYDILFSTKQEHS